VNRDRPLTLAPELSPSRAAVVRRWAPVLTVLAALAFTAWSLFSTVGPRPPRQRPPATAPVTREPVKRPLDALDAALVS
jgi:hypothetical protein